MGSPWYITHLHLVYRTCGHSLNVQRRDQGVSDHYGCQCTGCADACEIVFDELCPICRYQEDDCYSWKPVPVESSDPKNAAWLLEILNKGIDPVSDGAPTFHLEVQGPVTYKGPPPFLGVLGIQ